MLLYVTCTGLVVCSVCHPIGAVRVHALCAVLYIPCLVPTSRSGDASLLYQLMDDEICSSSHRCQFWAQYIVEKEIDADVARRQEPTI